MKPRKKRKLISPRTSNKTTTHGNVCSEGESSENPKRKDSLSSPKLHPSKQKSSTLSAKLKTCDSRTASDSSPSEKRPSPVGIRKARNKNVVFAYPKRKRKKVRKKKAKPTRSVKNKIQETPKQPDITVGKQDNGEYEVEEVVAEKVVDGRKYYFVKWMGWEDQFNTWEPVGHLTNSPESLVDFHNIKCSKRLLDLSLAIPQIKSLTGPSHTYETEVVQTLTNENYKKFKVDSVDNLCSSMLPDACILTSNISERLKNNSNEALEREIRKMIVQREFIRRRYEQLANLSKWKQNFSSQLPSVRIKVENNVDLEELPTYLEFIEHSIPGAGTNIPEEPSVGCKCKKCGQNPACCSVKSGGCYAYTDEGFINVPPGTPIYECNKTCQCGMDCPNRVVQRGSDIEFCIFRTSNDTGWGAKVLQNVPKGSFVCEYVGELISSAETAKRIKTIYKGLPLYIFDLDYNDPKKFIYSLDAFTFCNITHFVNHSCDPNLIVYACWMDCTDPNLPRLAMFARRDIKANEEITFDYSAEHYKQRRKRRKRIPQNIPPGKCSCKCGSPMCKQELF